jgi:hypothetical protein
VVEVVKSQTLKADDVIQLRQAGGVLEGVLQDSAGNPAIRVGPTYLFFLVLSNDGIYRGSPFARFELDTAGRLITVDPTYWDTLPGVQALVGRTVPEAKAVIEAAVAGQRQ